MEWTDRHEEWLRKEMTRRAGYTGMGGPYKSETASAKGDEDWPVWIVRNETCNSLGCCFTRAEADKMAERMNAIEEGA